MTCTQQKAKFVLPMKHVQYWLLSNKQAHTLSQIQHCPCLYVFLDATEKN